MRPEVDAVFAALADPTRRGLLDQISRHGPLTATELASDYPMSRQAVAKHLSALATAGLVTGERQGRDVRYRMVADGLGDAATWLAEVGDRWDRRLAALQRHLTSSSPEGGGSRANQRR
ncbi:MAG: metalloregulator ArsR/SmtB family transcription factor [Actinomycetota bacterium]|nr:metalloregulator ArsR/SmtB family transcription factor [Actinomycetota bacterium]